MELKTESHGQSIVADTDLIPGLEEITKELFLLRTDPNGDHSLLDNYVVVGSKTLKPAHMKNLLENRGGYVVRDIFFVSWSHHISEDKKSLALADNQWMIVFAWDEQSDRHLPKYIYNKAAYSG